MLDGELAELTEQTNEPCVPKMIRDTPVEPKGYGHSAGPVIDRFVERAQTGAGVSGNSKPRRLRGIVERVQALELALFGRIED